MTDWYLRVGPGDICTAAGELFNRGGEGEIHRLRDKIWKLFFQMDDELANKLHWMVGHPLPATASSRQPEHAWPERLIFKQGRVAGYEARYFDRMRPLTEALEVEQRLATVPHWTYRHSVRLAANMAHAIARIHDHGIVIGDVSAANVLFDPATACCAFVDLDSVQIDTGTRQYPCRVATPGTTPAEVLSGQVPMHRRSVHQDAYGIAALIFQLLLEHHPYAGILPATMPPLTTEQRTCQNVWTYGPTLNGQPIQIPPYGIPLSSLPDELGRLFDAAMNAGFVDPSQRPLPHAWIRPLERLYRSLNRCPAHPRHYFSSHLTACPWCEKRHRTGSDSFVDG